MHHRLQIGVGEASLPQLKTIASDPDQKYMYKVDNFDAINSIRNSLVERICAEENHNIGKKIEVECITLMHDAFCYVYPEFLLHYTSEHISLVTNKMLTDRAFPIKACLQKRFPEEGSQQVWMRKR